MKALSLSLVVLCCLHLSAHTQNSPVQVEVLFDNLTLTVIPYLHKSTVLFQDFSGGSIRFYTLDIENQKVTEIRRNTNYLYPVAFSGGRVSWIEYSTQTDGGGGARPGGTTDAAYHVKSMGLSDKIVTDLTSQTSYKEHIAAHGNRVVWSDYRFFADGDTTVEIYMYDFSTGQERRITEAKGYKAYPHIYGDIIVWQDFRDTDPGSDHAAIYMFNLKTQTETAVTTHPSYKAQPHVYNNNIVWQDFRNSQQGQKHTDIFMKNLDTGAETQISSETAGFKNTPKIFNNYIVWQDFRNAQKDSLNADIYMYDLVSKTELPVTNKLGYMGEPSLWNNKVVWQDHSDEFLYIGSITKTSVVYTVEFESNGGTAISTIVVGSGEKIAAPIPPEKSGYSFNGWYRDNTGDQKWVFSDDVVTADMTLYAKWVDDQLPTTYTVRFESNGGTVVSDIEAESGEKIAAPTPPEKSGYSFDGWYSDNTGAQKWVFSDDVVTADMTLYAKWVDDETATENLYRLLPVKSGINQTQSFYSITGRKIHNPTVNNRVIIRKSGTGEVERIIDLK